MNHMALRLRTPNEVDRAAEYLQSKGVKVLKGPQTHKEDRDRYLYFEDPDGNMIELVASTVEGCPHNTSDESEHMTAPSVRARPPRRASDDPTRGVFGAGTTSAAGGPRSTRPEWNTPPRARRHRVGAHAVESGASRSIGGAP